MSLTHLANSTHIVWKLLKSYNYDPSVLFRKKGLNPDLMENPEARVKFKLVMELWEKASEMIKDPCFGLTAAEYWHPSYMNALGYAWLSSRTLREALDRLVLYLRIVTEGTEIKIDNGPEDIVVELIIKHDAHPPAFADANLAILMHMCRANYGKKLKPVVVNLIHDASKCYEKYEMYFRSKIVFNSNKNSITLFREDVDKSLSTSSPYLAEVNDQIIIKYIEKLDEENITNRVKATILDILTSGGVTDEKVSKLLYMGVRTLQRRLKKEGTTFQSVLNETRKELAKKYIRDPSIRLEEIAFLLGFSEYSVFSKAFKRWTGSSPRDF